MAFPRPVALVALVVGCGVHSGADDGASELKLIENPAAAPAWAVPYGHEPWHEERGMDVSHVIERVHHAIRVDPMGLPRVKGRGYDATFDGDGMRFAVGDAALRVQTNRVSFGDDVVYARHGVPWSLLGNTAQARLAPSLVEHYEARGDGIELAWLVRERAAGDLTIDVELDGLLTVAQADGAVQLVDSAGHARGQIGAAELVDANGQHFALETHVVTGGVRWRASADVVAQAQFPIAIDPLISAEKLVADPVLGTSFASQTTAHVAASATGYLVVWTDNRDAEVSYSPNSELGEMYAARVSPQGVLLDPAGVDLGYRPDGPTPQIASNGTDYLIVFHDGASPGPIQALRMSQTGVLDATPIVISATGFSPVVASNGADYLVAWLVQGAMLQDTVYATRVTAGGTVLDPNGILVATPTRDPIAVGSNGSNYIVAYVTWATYPAIPSLSVSRVAFDGTLLDPAGVPVATDGGAWAPAIASDGSNYLVAWENHPDNFESDVLAAVVAGSGVVSTPNGFVVTTATGRQHKPEVAWNGTTYLAVWEDPRGGNWTHVFGARISSAGTVTDVDGFPIMTDYADCAAPSVAAYGGDFLVAWQQVDRAINAAYGDVSDRNVYAQRITSAGAPAGTKFPLALTPGMFTPAIASNNTTFFVVWKDARAYESTGQDILGARLSAAGDTLDPAGIVVSNAPSHQTAPVVASNGSDYLVAWRDFRNDTTSDVYGARVSGTGAVLDSTGLLLSSGAYSQTQVTVASNGTDYLVAWNERDNIYGTRVTNAGGVLDPTGISLATGSETDHDPSLGSNGTSYLLAWVQNYDMVARRLMTSGVPDTAAVKVSFTMTGYFDRPAVTSNGTDYVVAWRGQNGFEQMFATRVSAAGTLLDTAPVWMRGGINDCQAAAASDGTDYVIAWGDCYSSVPDVYAGRLSAGGVVADSTRLVIAGSPASERNPSIAYNAASHGYAIAYESRNQVSVVRLVRFCGDSKVDGTETCDDGGYTNGDGCNASCRVEPGYICTGSPSTCSDINECATNNGGCSPNAACTNSTPGFSCVCASGYAGDGFTCTDIDECATNNGGCAGTCTNSAGSYTCSCAAGFVLAADGHACDDIDECATNNGDCAGTCTNSAGAYACSCAAGFVLAADGHACDDIDECATNNGDCAATCTNAAGSYACSCPTGFVLAADGHACVDLDECATNNGGCAQTCTNNAGGFSCACEPGYVLGSDQASCAATGDTGCGCHTNEPSQSVLWLLVLGLVVRERSRRSRR